MREADIQFGSKRGELIYDGRQQRYSELPVSCFVLSLDFARGKHLLNTRSGRGRFQCLQNFVHARSKISRRHKNVSSYRHKNVTKILFSLEVFERIQSQAERSSC